MVVKVGGAKCPCGRHGCMEAYAGRGAMETRARELAKKGEQTDLFQIMEKRGRQRLTSGIWARALVRHDPMAVRLVDRAIEALGAGVGRVNLLDVEAVILGGGLGVRLGDPYRKRLEHAMLPHVFADTRPPPVLLAQLGDLGGAIGAALLASEAETAAAGAAAASAPSRRSVAAGSLEPAAGLPVVPSASDRAVHGAEDPQHGADDDQHDADRVEDADAQHKAEDQQQQSKQNHGVLPPVLGQSCGVMPRGPPAQSGRSISNNSSTTA